jgi:hypothetical protein
MVGTVDTSVVTEFMVGTVDIGKDSWWELLTSVW